MRLVEFTQIVGAEQKVSVWVNPEHVCYVWRRGPDRDTSIKLVQGGTIEVKETMDTVLSRLEERHPYMPGLWEE